MAFVLYKLSNIRINQFIIINLKKSYHKIYIHNGCQSEELKKAI